MPTGFLLGNISPPRRSLSPVKQARRYLHAAKGRRPPQIVEKTKLPLLPIPAERRPQSTNITPRLGSIDLEEKLHQRRWPFTVTSFTYGEQLTTAEYELFIRISEWVYATNCAMEKYWNSSCHDNPLDS